MSKIDDEIEEFIDSLDEEDNNYKVQEEPKQIDSCNCGECKEKFQKVKKHLTSIQKSIRDSNERINNIMKQVERIDERFLKHKNAINKLNDKINENQKDSEKLKSRVDKWESYMNDIV